MVKYVFDKKGLKKVDKIEELWNKVCKFAEYYEQGKKGRSLELAALADVLLCIREIFRSHDEQFKRLEKRNLELREINETGGATKIKLVGLIQTKKRKVE